MTSFVPRPIYRVKNYGYVVEKGDTPSKIAGKFGRPAGDYRELVAANLHQRTLMPMALGSPYASRTFASLSEGEVLRVPATWKDPPGVQPSSLAGEDETSAGMLGAIDLDPLAQAMASATQAANAGSGGVYDQTAQQAITNAALQWWHSSEGTTPAANPAQYVPYVQGAIGWLATHGLPAMNQTGMASTITAFPWGAFLGMLPASVDLTQVNWANGSIPGTNGVPWASIPWGYLGLLGPALEMLKLPPVQWPSDTSPAAVLAAIQAAVQAAQGGGGGAVGTKVGDACGQSSHVGTDFQCYCDPGTSWASATGFDCIPVAGGGPIPPAKQGAQACSAGAVYDPSAPGGAGCFACNPGQTYDFASHTCLCPTGQLWNTMANACKPPAKSQADCLGVELFDTMGPTGAHCYSCDAPMHYSAATHQCECPDGQSWSGTACVQGAAPGPVQKACPQGSTLDPKTNACVQSSPPVKKDGAATNAITDDSGSNTALYVGLGVIALAIGGGGIYMATRKSKKADKAEKAGKR